VKFCTTLTYNDVTSNNLLTAKDFYAKHFWV
jgi:hypothetical protein